VAGAAPEAIQLSDGSGLAPPALAQIATSWSTPTSMPIFWLIQNGYKLTLRI